MQSELFEQSFATLAPGSPIFCHQEFLEKLQTYRNQPIAKRAGLLMQRLVVDERRQHYKSTQGVNRGWRRSRLGGNGGNHFYAWWAPKTALPLKGEDGFREAPEGAIFLRDIRHHDDHSLAGAQSFHEHYLPISVLEMRREEYGPAPWTAPQARFASSRHFVRILKGHPGSGKTTALLHAVDASGADRVLYLTYSRELAVLARQYFDRYCSRARHFHVATFDTFLRELLEVEAAALPLSELRRQFRGDLASYSRSHGAWTDRTPALYDEFHAHLVGGALPLAAGRFAACTQPRVADKHYRERRARYLGESAASAALDLAARLERSRPASLAASYFPELALAWQAACALSGKGPARISEELLDFGCIGVDECQDLTPLESLVIIELAGTARRRRGAAVQIFLAGDEAQTVRPTDFEWAWMNDLLHHRIGTPAEFKLASNLRSPRRIAELVNGVWDLYAEVEKRDRPSGAGYAEIEDDATDQVFYCTAAAGQELDRLLADLASREGLAIVLMDESARDSLPEFVRPNVLTVPEVKGLDFHTVCLINAGRQLEAVLGWRHPFGGAYDIESIRRRLAIDELRVALSRPADRLIWLDINPPTKSVRTTLEFLNRNSFSFPLSPVLPEAVLTALEEEPLDLEERVQRCQSDARQYLSVKPELAWSRAQQAVALLGDPQSLVAVQDQAVRNAARLTLAEICFCLAFRRVNLAAELGRPDLFHEAANAALAAGRSGLSAVIRCTAEVIRAAAPALRLPALGNLAQAIARHRDQLEAWFLVETSGHTAVWVEELESALTAGDNSLILTDILPPLYEVLRLPDAEARKRRLVERATRFLMKNRRYAPALQILEGMPERQPELEAECLEGMGEHRRAAELYRSIGKLKEALTCYRAIPDFEAAVALIREVGAHPAAEAYEWLDKLRRVVAERPANFNRVMQASEKKVLEQVLEEALGVARKRPAPRKTTAGAAKSSRNKPRRRNIPIPSPAATLDLTRGPRKRR
jgi:hypothetical protein